MELRKIEKQLTKQIENTKLELKKVKIKIGLSECLDLQYDKYIKGDSNDPMEWETIDWKRQIKIITLPDHCSYGNTKVEWGEMCNGYHCEFSQGICTLFSKEEEPIQLETDGLETLKCDECKKEFHS